MSDRYRQVSDTVTSDLVLQLVAVVAAWFVLAVVLGLLIGPWLRGNARHYPPAPRTIRSDDALLGRIGAGEPARPDDDAVTTRLKVWRDDTATPAVPDAVDAHHAAVRAALWSSTAGAGTGRHHRQDSPR